MYTFDIEEESVIEILVVEADAPSDDIGVTSQILGHRVNNHVCSKVKWVLEEGSQESIIYYK